MIGAPVTAPAKPMPGKRFTVSFVVRRSDTHARLTSGKMICDPAVAGKVLRHAESFRGGTARLSFLIPKTTQGKILKVNVTIRAANGLSAHRVSTFRIGAARSPLAIGDAGVAEGNAGYAALSFPVTLATASSQTVSVDYATADGTATAPSDYVAASGTLTFEPGETTKTLSVQVVGETLVESDETLTVTLSNPVNATLGRTAATGTITNDDVAPRSGHYAGTTSQGRPISFDVASDLASLTHLVFYTDLSCPEVGDSMRNQPLDFGDDALAIGADWSFGFSDTVSGDSGSGTFSFGGRLATPGSATGTLRIDVTLNVPQVGLVHCSTGAVTWNAS